VRGLTNTLEVALLQAKRRPRLVIAQEDRFLMKKLVESGVPKARVARDFGVSRQAVYDLLKRPEKPQRRRRTSKLDPFKEYIEERLGKFDLPATVLLEEIRERGYSGGITILSSSRRSSAGACPRSCCWTTCRRRSSGTAQMAR
jgi:transposase